MGRGRRGTSWRWLPPLTEALRLCLSLRVWSDGHTGFGGFFLVTGISSLLRSSLARAERGDCPMDTTSPAGVQATGH